MRLLHADLVQSAQVPAQLRRPMPTGEAQRDMEPEYGPFRQRYLELQRRIEWRVEPFRQHCRVVLSQTSARLKHLAALDMAMEQVLAAREKMLLATVPAQIERRFSSSKKAHATASKDAAQGVGPAWLARFEREFQELLLAEVEFRLLPVRGLVEAFANTSHEGV